ncbi:hypothetical protein V6N12_015116 [Hibiscus sabdariffa]|uniref:EXS domain-containing protein n=1 Tax=Hibiscus sabdariffa TaxID=183260 RepID=A0ABR2DM74_9ROSI
MQAFNGLKYFLTIVAVCMRTAYGLDRRTSWEALAWMFSAMAAIYGTYWDLVVDWGLLQRQSKNRWLRDKLLIPYKSVYFGAMRCVTVMESDLVAQLTERRSGGYLPTVWDTQLINSLSTPYMYESDGSRLEELKQAARCLFSSVNPPDEKLDMINKMQRLDIAKFFDKEINEFLAQLNPNAATDLFTQALQFRLLRHHGFFVTSDVFNKLMNSDGKVKEKLSEDVEGLLSLYEASYLGLHGEDDVLEEANTFTTKHLKLAMENLEDKDLAHQIKESLEVPLHRRLPSVEARNFIHIYQRDGNNNLVLLELAKLNFNLLQSVYLSELKELAGWWEGLNMKEKVPFARDRMVECYFWAMGSVPEPKFYKCRRNLTKYGSLATVLDDVYDIYGSLDELQKYTTAVKRWDVEVIEELPEYMKICYKAMYEHVNEMVEDALNAHGVNILPYIKDQRMKSEILVNFTRKEIESCTNLKLWDHFLKLEMERGEVTNSIQCYMIEEGVSEEEARDYIKSLISESWKRLNKLVVDPSLPTGFAKSALTMTRCVQRMYQFGDWFGIQSSANKDAVTSSLFNRVQNLQ